MSSFSRTRTIYELTNNLDAYLLFHLKRDFMIFSLKKLKDELSKDENHNQEDIDATFSDVLTNVNFESYLESFDFNFSQCFDYEYLENFYDEINDFVGEIEDLEKYNKSSRQTVEGRDDIDDIEKKPYEGMDVDEYFEMLDLKEAEEADRTLANIESNESDDNYIFEENVSVSISIKMIYLERLGILDFLRKEEPFTTSTNRLAKILGRVIGAKSVTVQPYLNAMYGKNVSEKNNPLKSRSNVESVEEQLINIGYSIKKRKDNS